MSRYPVIVIAMSLFVCSGQLLAGKYNDVLNIGDAAPAWTDLPGIDDKAHSLSDLADKPVVVVVFTCNSCPVAVDYEDRIIALAKKHSAPDSRVAVVAINVNTNEPDRLPKMRQRAELKGFPFPYLFDESQEIGRQFGANFTPEFFVLDKDRKVVYMGGMDDNSDPTKVTVNYLDPAIEAVVAGKQPESPETVPRGCRVRYRRQRPE